jgi:hypothetical protein
VQLVRKRANRAIVASQRTLRLRSGQAANIARLAQILRERKSVSLRMTIQMLERWRNAPWQDRSGFDNWDAKRWVDDVSTQLL